MSYDIDLICEHCGSRIGGPDPTYNLSQIFDFALTGEDWPSPEVNEAQSVLLGKETSRPRGLRVLDGKTPKESVPMIEAAISRAFDPAHREKLLSLQPENGWGDLPGAQHVLGRLLEMAKENAETVLVWRIR